MLNLKITAYERKHTHTHTLLTHSCFILNLYVFIKKKNKLCVNRNQQVSAAVEHFSNHHVQSLTREGDTVRHENKNKNNKEWVFSSLYGFKVIQRNWTLGHHYEKTAEHTGP